MDERVGEVDKKRGKKRKAEFRYDIHNKISKFFLQFRQSNNFDDVRSRLTSWPYVAEGGAGYYDQQHLIDLEVWW